MNNRDKPRRLSTLSTVSLSQESSLLVRLESGEKSSYSSTDDEDEVIEVAAGRKGQLLLESSPNLVVELIVTFGVFVTGWYLPKKLIIPYLLGGIRERPIPYQTIASTGDVILDLNLSHPYVEQVIINGKGYLFFIYIGWMCCYLFLATPRDIITLHTYFCYIYS
jgi:hypothetical protein